MEWSNDEVIEFLQLYEGYPQIWNPRHPSHKNRNLVHDAWKEIENKLSVKTDITEIKKKKILLWLLIENYKSKQGYWEWCQRRYSARLAAVASSINL
ncbi:unnamed protein product [Macrosiphum euphorbiae]|uniref:MADF domain-containing protein n=1 Tax=Macrosiphum euphorbiae TaxID=13131 RepID=A0AAV0WME4_9HEMI|nr:unnamed protein product [Macrosiphum euphorbiae]